MPGFAGKKYRSGLPAHFFVNRRRSLQKCRKAFYGFARPLLPAGRHAHRFEMHWTELLTPSFEGLRRRLRGEHRHEPQVALPKLRLGSSDRGFSVVPDLMLRTSIVYSFGIGEDAGFDLDLIGHFGCTVHLFEPRPRYLTWIRSQALPPQFHVHPIGLSDRDGIMTHSPLQNSANGRARRNHAHPSTEFQVRRLLTLMKQFGHMHIDVLKVDLEDTEFVATHALATTSVRPTQILLEFQHDSRGFSAAKCERAIDELNSLGYRIFDCQPGGHRFSLALV
jgi:FkbM family methyltransferase